MENLDPIRFETSVSEVVTSATSNFLRPARGRIGAAVWTLVIAAAGPGVFPHGPAANAFVVVDESGLAAGLVFPLMGAFYFLLRQ